MPLTVRAGLQIRPAEFGLDPEGEPGRLALAPVALARVENGEGRNQKALGEGRARGVAWVKVARVRAQPRQHRVEAIVAGA